MLATTAFASGYSIPSFGGCSKKMPLTLLSRADSPNARCMDGSPGGYYLAANSSSASWVIELEGGGECASKVNCDGRKGSALISSKYFPKDHSPSFLLADSDANPRLRTFNRVFVPYCSQDLWTGQRTSASDETFGYYFAGRHVLAGVLDALDASSGLGGAKEIVLTGESAGGIGVWPNLDALAERYPKARVVGAPIAGFYAFAYPYTGPGHTSSRLADFREEAWPGHVALWDAALDTSCAAALGPSRAYRCMLSNYSYPHVSSHVFITEAQTDKVHSIA